MTIGRRAWLTAAVLLAAAAAAGAGEFYRLYHGALAVADPRAQSHALGMAIAVWEESDGRDWLANAYCHRGLARFRLGDTKKALEDLHRAARMGTRSSCDALSLSSYIALQMRRPEPSPMDRAVEGYALMRRGWRRFKGEAMTPLGRPGPKSPLQTAAEGGDPAAQFQLGLEDHEAGRLEAAEFWLNQAAIRGYPQAQLHLAFLYVVPSGLVTDPPKAEAFLTQCSEGSAPGYLRAQCLMLRAAMAEKGVGGPPERGRAAGHYFRALEVGEAYQRFEAMIRLGALYETGPAGLRDPAEAYKWYLLAAAMQAPPGSETRAGEALRRMGAVLSRAEAAEGRRRSQVGPVETSEVLRGAADLAPAVEGGERINLAFHKVAEAMVRAAQLAAVAGLGVMLWGIWRWVQSRPSRPKAKRSSRMLTPAHCMERLANAQGLLQMGLVEEAGNAIGEEVIDSAASDLASVRLAVRILRDTGKVGDFAREYAGRSSEFYTAYAEAFFEAGDPALALALLRQKKRLEPRDFATFVACHKALARLEELKAPAMEPRERLGYAQALIAAGEEDRALGFLVSDQASLGGAEYSLAVRLASRKGDFAMAEVLFGKARETLTAKQAPSLYSCYATACVKAGRPDPAREALQHLAHARPDDRRCRARLRFLEGLSKEEAGLLRLGSAPAAPAMAGNYRLLSPLGSGPTGVLIKAADPGLRAPVAMRRLGGALSLDPQAVKLAAEEARRFSGLHHPALVSLRDVVAHDGAAWIVLDYIDGDSLAEIVAAEGPLEAESCLAALRVACGGLALMHEQGFLHRDLRVSNFLRTRAGEIKLTDFGIASRVAEALGWPLESLGIAVESLAPEVRGGRATPQSDVYALGAAAVEMVTGLPLSGRSGPPQGLSEPLRGVLAACLALEPGRRPMDAREVLRMLSAK